MSSYIKNFASEFLKYRRALLVAMSLIVLVGQFASIGAKLYQNTDIRAVIYADDNDGARAIQTTMQTRWWNSNHFAPYGPLYFRLSHTLAFFLKPFDDIEKNHHWALMLLSLICLYGFCYLLASIVVKETWLRFVFTAIAVSLLDMPHWVYMVFRPHPDMLLLLIIGLATQATANYIFEETRTNFRKAAMLWGIAVGTKATTLMFTPALVFLFFPKNKTLLVKLVEFIFWMFLAYTVVGFPQSLSYFKVTKFLIFESRNSVVADMDSIAKYLTYSAEGGGKLLMFVLVALLSMLASFKFEWRKPHTRLLVFVMIPFVTMLTRQMLSFDHHFVFPFVSCLMVGVAYVLTKSCSLVERPYWALCLFVVPLVPTNYESLRLDLQKCRPEAREFYNFVSELKKDSVRLLHDPYLPFPSNFQNKTMLWGIRWEDVFSQDANVLAIRQKFYRRYLNPPEKFKALNQAKTEWPARKDFYTALDGKAEFEDSSKHIWKRVYENSCGMFVYQKVD